MRITEIALSDQLDSWHIGAARITPFMFHYEFGAVAKLQEAQATLTKNCGGRNFRPSASIRASEQRLSEITHR